MIDLRLGDCLDVMRGIPDASIDAVITDPPYGIGFKYAGNYSDKWDTKEYGRWLWDVVSLAESKCTAGAPLFIWQAMLNVTRFSEWFPRQWRIFAAAKNFVQMRPTAMQYSFDPVVVWWKEGAKPFSKGTASRDFHIANTNPSARKRGMPDYVEGHPCPRPLAQVEHVIDQWTREGDTILDPFMGSGTTGVACVKLNRSFIGIEINPQYYAIAQRRIQEAQAQIAMPMVTV